MITSKHFLIVIMRYYAYLQVGIVNPSKYFHE